VTKLWIIGSKQLVVKVDTQYIKGMLNKPDLHPNAVINRWIAAILMFDFKLVHVLGAKHRGLDGLSRRRVAENEGEEEEEEIEETEDWMDEVIACGMQVARQLEKKGEVSVLATGEKIVNDKGAILERKEERSEGWNELMQLRKKEREISRREKEIKEIRSFLDTLKLPKELTEKTKLQFL